MRWIIGIPGPLLVVWVSIAESLPFEPPVWFYLMGVVVGAVVFLIGLVLITRGYDRHVAQADLKRSQEMACLAQAIDSTRYSVEEDHQ